MSVYAEFWAAVEARDWHGLRGIVAERVVATWPQSRERCVGVDALVAFLAAYPGDWHLEFVTEHADDRGGATQIAFTAEGATQPGLTFFTVDGGGMIATIVEFWPDPYEPPDRGGTLERY